MYNHQTDTIIVLQLQKVTDIEGSAISHATKKVQHVLTIALKTDSLIR